MGFLVLDADEGGCTIAVWPSLQKDFLVKIVGQPGLYEQSTVTILQNDFIRIKPIKPLDGKFSVQKVVKTLAQPGLAYLDSNGTLLISLSEAPVPEGFHLAGQAAVDLNSVDAWKGLKGGAKVFSSGERKI